jgi:AraC family transcriptional regulator
MLGEMCHSDEFILENSLFKVGEFRRAVGERGFSDPDPIKREVIVFPRTAVQITFEGQSPIASNPNLVLFYNQGQVYRRDELSERGDRCEYFSLHPAVLREIVRWRDPGCETCDERPFRFAYGPNDSHTYMLQRLVVEHISRSETPDCLYLEEMILIIAESVIDNAYRVHMQTRDSQPRPEHAELARQVQTLLGTRYRQPLTLDQIAKSVHCSPYHLSRVFREQTGLTIHRYLNAIRLKTSLEEVANGDKDLTRIALELGYSSHSHFTQSFRRAFKLTPSEFRSAFSYRLFKKTSKNLIAHSSLGGYDLSDRPRREVYLV